MVIRRTNIVVMVILCFCSMCCFAQQKLQWEQVYPGIWKAVAGNPDKITLLSAAGGTANKEAIAALPDIAFPLLENDIEVKVVDHQTYLRFPLDKEEQLFGLGLNFKTVNQRGRILRLHVDHYGNDDNGRTHAPVPFYISSKGYGVLINAARYITVYAGTTVRADSKNPPVLYNRNTDKNWDAQPYSDAVEILVPADGAELYVFGGPTPMNVVQRYNLMNGGGNLPPKWGLGFTQRVPTLFTQQDILKETEQFEEHQFPLDFIGLEPGWQSMSYPGSFEWDNGRFPDPKALIDTLLTKGIRTNLWFNPYVSPKAPMYPFIKPFSGSHTVWNGMVPDFILPESRKLFKEKFVKNHLDLGVSGYKIDEVDGFDNWLWPDVATFPSGTSAEQMRQVYGLLMQNMTDGWFREKNQRTYGLIRASNAGASSFPYVIYNDNYSHKNFITALINSSFIGVLWTPEVRSSENAEEWLRRMQTACFSPMAMLNAWSDGTKPWSFPEVEDAVRAVANLRIQLLPYLYTCFAQYRFEGKPPFRAMNLVDGFAFKGSITAGKLDAVNNPYAMSIKQDINDQYMVGDLLLVAPMFAGEKSREVLLPAGKWYDFYTGRLAGENQKIRITPGLDKIPLFVRDGGIIPMIPVRRQAGSNQLVALTAQHYGTAESTFNLYDDDGTTFNFEKGDYSFTKLSVKKTKGGKLKGFMEKPAAGKPFAYKKEVVWKWMTAQD